MSTFQLEIVVPDRAFYSDEVEEIVIKTPDGEIGILGGHIPMVAAVSIGLVKIKKDDKWLSAFISEGFLKVSAEKTVVIADSAEWPEEIDIERAKAAEERARERLSTKQSSIDYARTEAALQRALLRQKAAQKSNK